MSAIPLSTINHDVGAYAGNGITTDAQVHIDMEPRFSDDTRYRKNRPKSMINSNAQGGSVQRAISFHGASDHDISKHLMQKLPSHQLANQVKQVLASQNQKSNSLQRKKSKVRRRPGYHTLRHYGDVVDSADQAADQLENNDEDFLDMTTEDQANAIKNTYASASLAEKKAIKAEILQRRKKKHSKKPGPFKRMKYSISLSWSRFRTSMAEVSYSVDLWRSHFKRIEGHFGTGVTSYFKFIKFLFLLNIPVFLLIFSFVVIPQLLYRYIEIEGYNNNTEFSAEQILTGSGWFNETELYYGAYTNDNVTIIDNHIYSMQYAYLCTTFGYYILVLIITMISLSKSYRKNYIESSQEFNFYYVAKVFSGWDYGISNQRAAMLRHKSLFKEFQEYLSGFQKDEEKMTVSKFCSIFALRAFTNLLVIALLVGSAYLVWYISITQSLGNDIDFLMEMALPLTISAINFILPFAFSIISSFERYSRPQTELYMTMFRTIVLNVCTLGVLIYFWFSSVDCSQRQEDDGKWLDSELECRPCWETFLGVQIYRLVIVDFIFILVITFLSEFVRRLMSQFCCKSLGYPEFNIGRNTLNLIYSQILIWIGTFYSPLLSFIQLVKLFVIFYVKRISVTQNCVPSVKPWRGGRSHTVILGLMFAAFLLCLFAVGFSIVFLRPSEICGPYIGLDSSYQVLTDLFTRWQETNPDANNALEIFLEVITSFFFVVALFLILCVIAHWSRVVANGHKEMTDLLRHQISMEGKDKIFLLRLLKEAVKNTPNLITAPSIDNTMASSVANSPTEVSQISLARSPSSNEATSGVYNPGFLDNSGEFNMSASNLPTMNPEGMGEVATAGNKNKKHSKKQRDKSKDRKKDKKSESKNAKKKNSKK